MNLQLQNEMHELIFVLSCLVSKIYEKEIN